MKLSIALVFLACALFEVATAGPAPLGGALYGGPNEGLDDRGFHSWSETGQMHDTGSYAKH
ncbi:hypothetical protein EVJ58_g10476 [Rhodofomes roseus]|uniref:Uncharacterized protein n=1 Tax=Rhodofomes roseus TaxID=34475 RepID=A0A4Y9XNE5_9APHY|nr:hypothetical protein EVJ58_g10476 [Rhodofomes roseus]